MLKWFCILLGLSMVTSYRILGIFPHGARSHFNMVDALMTGLAKRGHDVVVISPFPRKAPLKHYTDVSLADDIMDLTSEIPLDIFSVGEDIVWFSVAALFHFGQESCEKVLALPQVQKLTEQKFDLVIYELFNTDCFIGFANQFQVPYMAISSSAMMPWHHDRFGNPDNPSYIPVHFLPHSDHMSYTQRFKNVFYYQTVRWAYYFFNELPATALVKKLVGETVPSLADLAKNTSLVLINNHFTLSLPRPLAPGIIEVGGIHIKPTEELPKDIARFIEEAKHGVVYFSFGSTVKAATFPEDKRRGLIEAFSEMPQRFLWKWEGEMEDKPDNVMISKWLPQATILNHPKVVLFISHGGLMGSIEAVAAGVPMISVPLFGDQPLNVAALVDNGVALRLNYPDINKINVLTALKSVLENPRYAENAKLLAQVFNDRPMPPLDTAIYWTEYVIKHKGAPQLQLASVHLAWYQYLLIDVLIPYLIIVLLIGYLLYLMVKKLINTLFALCFKRNDDETSTKTNKKQKKN